MYQTFTVASSTVEERRFSAALRSRNNPGLFSPRRTSRKAAKECSPQPALSLPKGRKPWV
jgi:hypothetical protein